MQDANHEQHENDEQEINHAERQTPVERDVFQKHHQKGVDQKEHQHRKGNFNARREPCLFQHDGVQMQKNAQCPQDEQIHDQRIEKIVTERIYFHDQRG